MLENGADVRVIQQMLGHVKITTTEIYTHIAINLLKHFHSTTHPAAHLKRAEAEAGLLAALDAEAEEDNEEEEPV